jgi:hypothetical protein
MGQGSERVERQERPQDCCTFRHPCYDQALDVHMRRNVMAKGQKRSNREAKKPKKAVAARQKTTTKVLPIIEKEAPKK